MQKESGPGKARGEKKRKACSLWQVKPETIPLLPFRSDDLNETGNKMKRIQGERLIEGLWKFLKSWKLPKEKIKKKIEE